jgi:ornithine carbamoyltransferase
VLFVKRDFVSILDAKDDLISLMDSIGNLKNRQKDGELYEPLKNCALAMIFEKPSTRTRVSFEIAMAQMGGHALYLNPNDIHLGRGETIADTAKVLSRYADGILFRGFKHGTTLELARNAEVPVINGLDDLEHPCQALTDLFTVREFKGEFDKVKLAYVGDGNNVCNSLMLGSAIVGLDIAIGTPNEFRPEPGLTKEAEKIAGEKGSVLEFTDDPAQAVKGADVVYTDVWISMGMELEADKRNEIFKPYQVNSGLLGNAKEDCIVMHCLPAHRGHEITDEVMDGKNSVVFDQAENRLHAQKALLVNLLG